MQGEPVIHTFSRQQFRIRFEIRRPFVSAFRDKKKDAQSSKDKSNYAVVHLGALGILQKEVWAFKSSQMMATNVGIKK